MEVAQPPREWFEQQQSRPVPIDPEMARGAYIAKGDAKRRRQIELRRIPYDPESGFDAKQIPISWREQRQAQR
jgi:hypothetical protein